MKRCTHCNKSRHYNCNGGNCECKCREYEDNIKGRDEKHRLSDPANDDFIDELNKKFRSLQNTVTES